MNDITNTPPNIKPMTFPSQYSLHNADNYLEALSSNNHAKNTDILNKYKTLVIEYLQFILENMNCKSDELYKYIILRGLTTITHVFQLIFLNTKNLNLSYFHSQKAFYYYVEFIGQITGEENTFLQLTSKDAIMFVYKKTIFEIHNDFRKSESSQHETIIYESLHLLDLYCQIMKMIVGHFINQNDVLQIRSYKICINELKKIEKTGEIINNHKANISHLEKIKIVIDSFTDINENYHESIQTFITKFYKSKIQNMPENKFRENISIFFLKNESIDLFSHIESNFYI